MLEKTKRLIFPNAPLTSHTYYLPQKNSRKCERQYLEVRYGHLTASAHSNPYSESEGHADGRILHRGPSISYMLKNGIFNHFAVQKIYFIYRIVYTFYYKSLFRLIHFIYCFK